MLTAETTRAADIATTHPAHRRSAANLVHYLELRHQGTFRVAIDCSLLASATSRATARADRASVARLCCRGSVGHSDWPTVKKWVFAADFNE